MHLRKLLKSLQARQKARSARKPSSARLHLVRLEDREAPSVDLVTNWVYNPSSARAGDSLSVSALVSNQGDSSSGYFPVGIYANTSPYAGTSGILLGTDYVALGPWSSTWLNESIRLPSWLSGHFYLTVAADPWYWTFDSNRSNNALASWNAITVSAPQSDLAVYAVSAPSSARAGDTVGISVGVGNWSNSYGGNYTIAFYASTSPYAGTSGIFLQSDYRAGLGAWSSEWFTKSIHLPSWLTGRFYITAVVDPWFNLADSNRSNNSLASWSPTTISAPSGLATPQNVDALARIITAEAGGYNIYEQTAVGWTVRNRMTRDNTTSVADVARAYTPAQYTAFPTQQIRNLALSILQSTVPDPTNGATHFYSPISMPKEGEYTGGSAVGGGLEWTYPLTKRNYRPSWALTYEAESVAGVRPWAFKFYKQPGNGYVW